MRKRAWAAAALGSAVAVLTACGAPSATTTSAQPPQAVPGAVVETLAVVGDSISLGVNACGSVSACPEVSWATGSSPGVSSIAQRLESATGTRPETVVAAQPGADVGDVAAAAATVAAAAPDLVLVLIGANDACRPSADRVTPAAEFEDAYARMLDGIHAAAPDVRVVAYSVPDLEQLWQLGRDDPRAVALWNSSPSCGSLLGDADSTDAADVARRARVVESVDAYNVAIRLACDARPWCTSDDGAVHATSFARADVSEVDFFHPSTQGQATLAARAWPAVERALPSATG
ncbi:GDSL-type esterase/lipase family protein [Microbacterium awajiense]